MRRFDGRRGRLLIAGSVLAAAMAAGMTTTATATADNKPTMKLRVSTHSGPMPLTLELSGSFTASEPGKWGGCAMTVERNYITPGGTHLNSKEEIPCVEGQIEPAGNAPASFKRTMILKEPGTYSYRMILVGPDGKRLASTSQEVKVYRGHTELGVIGTHSSDRR